MPGTTDDKSATSAVSARKLAERLQAHAKRGPLAALSRFVSGLLAATVVLAVISLGIEHGFYEPPAAFLTLARLHACQLAAVTMFVLSRLLQLVGATKRLGQIRANWLDYSLIGIGATVLAIESGVTHVSVVQAGTLYILTVQVLILARLGIKLVRTNLELAQKQVHPTRILAGSFGALVLIGAILLSLPRASEPVLWGDSQHYVVQHLVNCLFTAVSATCVTGLVVYDTGSDFTLFGQAVILALMQLGGLGIMIFGGVVGVLMGRQISLRESLVLQDAVSKNTVGQIGSLVRFIFVATFVIEAMGALLLYPMWDPEITSVGQRCFLSVFHSVSAFCNAGFSLQADSLVAYRGRWQMFGAVMPLIIIGGLGFPAVQDLFATMLARLRHRWEGRRAGTGTGGRSATAARRSLTLHTKLVLASTLVLILGGAVLLLFCETPSPITARHIRPIGGVALEPPHPESMHGMGFFERAGVALFQSVTARTAGFNTVRMDTESMSPAAHFLLCVLMFVGGSPASTAGGVKTVTVTVLMLSVLASLRRRENTEAFGRTIGRDLLTRAAVLVIGMFGVVTLVTFALAVTEDAPLQEVLFESVSACGTVGLSTGLTPRLTGIGKVVIMLGMFAGRLGPLTFLIALAGRSRPVRYEYPQEQVVIG